MMRRRPPPPSPRRLRGFSLIEIMIGLLIGMFGVLIVLQLLSAADANRRITVGSGDAQTNAMTSLYGLDRDVREAGLGISAFTVLGCSLSYTTRSDTAAVTLPMLAPVTLNPATSVIPAGDANTDTLLVLSGNSGSPSEGDALTATSTSNAYTVTAGASFTEGDYVMASPADRATPCALTLGAVTAVIGNAVTVSAGTAGIATGGGVYNLGNAPRLYAYAVRNGNLTRCDYLAYHCGNSSYASTPNSTVWVPVANNIVSLRAQYARDTAVSAMDGVADQFDQVTPGSATDTATSLALYCRWNRILGLRLVLVARSQQYDKTQPTSTVPTWDGSTANTATSSTLTTLNPTALPIDLSANEEWKSYRYKAVQTTIPLRNAVWQGDQATYQGGSGGC